MSIKVIVGLGNPGPKYAYTRHNIGFLTIDAISAELNVEVNQAKFKSLIGETSRNGHKVLLVKPMTFMNLSGEALREIVHFYKLPIDNLLVIYDDLDLPHGSVKLRFKGGSAGHNGLKSIIQHLGTEEFKRIKMGIGRPKDGQVVDYVLGRFAPDEMASINQAIEKAKEASLAFLSEDDFSRVMNKFNV